MPQLTEYRLSDPRPQHHHPPPGPRSVRFRPPAGLRPSPRSPQNTIQGAEQRPSPIHAPKL